MSRFWIIIIHSNLLLLLFSTSQANNKWNGTSQASLSFYLSGDYDKLYQSLFNIVFDSKQQTIGRQTAESNLTELYQKGIVPKNTTTPNNRSIDSISIITSINKEFGHGHNYSLDFEIHSHKISTINEIELSRALQPILTMKGEQLQKITDLHKIWFGKYTGLSEPLRSGAYVLTVKYDQDFEQFYFLLDDLGKIKKLPQFPKVTKTAKYDRVINWDKFKSSLFNEKRDKHKVYLFTSKKTNGKQKLVEPRGPASSNTAIIHISAEDDSTLDLGITYSEIHEWGQLKQINAINYRMPLQ